MEHITTALTHFHFIRPLWLFALILLPLIILTAKHLNYKRSAWNQAIDNQLSQYLLKNKPEHNARLPLLILLTAFGAGIIAQAGPTWSKAAQPLHKNEDALVIVMDLSLSMEATDIKPSRLIMARYKLLDILASRKDGQTALVVFAGAAHIVSPLTDDTETIAAMVPALSPLIMPSMGSNMLSSIKLANSLLKNSGIASGRILILNDGITLIDIEPLTKAINNSAHEFAMLTIGTDEGSPIPLPDSGFLKYENQIIIAKTETAILKTLASQTGMKLTSLQPDDSDIKYLLSSSNINFNQNTKMLEREFDQWQEQGHWLLLFIIPLVALGFRRGWLLGFMLTIMLQPNQSWAMSWGDLWQTKDQQAAETFNQGDYSQASNTFNNPEWKGSAAYKAGNYQAAAKHFGANNNATGYYNKANALAKAGKLDEAIQFYKQALELDASLENAKFNKKIVEKLKQDQQQQKSDKSDKSDNNDNQQNSEPKQPENSPQNESQQQQQQQQQNNEPSSQPKQEQEQSPNNKNDDKKEQQPTKPAAAQPADFKAAKSEQDQAIEQWLRKIPDDPGGLLKRKFDYQYRQNRIQNKFIDQKENKTIW